jgi:co-chaperonin GroES (HSP10)
MAFRAPLNKIIVQVTNRYTRGITNVVRAANMTLENQLNPADWVQLVATIVSVPKSVSREKRDYKGFSVKDMRVGDAVIMRHDVVYDLITYENKPPVHRNEVFYRGETYFIADVQKIFAVIREGEIIMQNGYVMLEPPVESKIILPAEMKRIRGAAESRVLYIGHAREGETPIDVQQGDLVYYNGTRVLHYEIGEKKFCIIEQGKIFGKAI